MKKIIWLAIVVVAVGVLSVWYFDGMSHPAVAPAMPPASSGTTTPVGAASTSPVSASSTPVMISSVYFSSRISQTLGTYLADAKGMTLYTFMKDAANKSNCTGVCLTKWFPYGPGISASGIYHLPMLPVNVGVIKGNTGMLQFTWKGMPLYTYFADKSVGQTLGQGVLNAWYVVRL